MWFLLTMDPFLTFHVPLSSITPLSIGVRDAVSVITDDKDKLARQLDRTSGDKYSALEEAGRLDVDKQRSAARDIGKPFDPGPVSDLSLANDNPPPAREADRPRAASDTPVQSVPTPEKSKGLEL